MKVITYNKLVRDRIPEVIKKAARWPLLKSYKYYDDLLKQNSLVYQNWKVCRWAYNQLKSQLEKVKDELVTFVGEMPV